MASVTEIGDSIAGLTLSQAVELKNYLKEKYGLEPAAGGVMIAGGGGGGAAAPVEEEKTAFDVVLKGGGDKKIQVIKVVREATGLGLKEAKELVDTAPKPVKTGLPKAEAEALAEKLKKEGADVEIK